MTPPTTGYRYGWAAVLAVMAGSMAVAVAVSPIRAGSPLWVGFVCGVVAAAASLVRQRVERSGGSHRWAIELALPAMATIGVWLVGVVAPALAVPVAWAAPLAFLAWIVVGATVADLVRIDRGASGEVLTTAVSRLGARFLLGAGLLVLLLTMGSRPQAYPAMSLYVAVGLGSLARLRYSVRRRGWTDSGMVVVGQFARRWLLCALALFALAAILSALVPTSVLVWAAGTTWGVVGPTFAAPAIWLLSQTTVHYDVQSGGTIRIRNAGADAGRPRTYQGHPAGHTTGVWAGLLMWTIGAVLLGYLGQAYWRHRISGMPWRIALLEPLHTAWERLRFLVNWFLEAGSAQLPDRVAVLLNLSGEGARWSVHGRLSPQQRIALYYLGILRRARRRGYPCSSAATPAEYAADLGPKLGDAHGDLTRLSTAFLEARYSRHNIAPSAADRARIDARRVRVALQRMDDQGARASSRAISPANDR